MGINGIDEIFGAGHVPDITGAARLARASFEAMFGRDPVDTDLDALTKLAMVFGSAEEVAHEMCERGIAEEREACADLAAAHSATGELIAEMIRARADL